MSITISPQWASSMFTGTRTNLSEPGSTFCKRSRKHWRMKLVSPVSSQVIVCASRHRTDSFEFYWRCIRTIAVSMIVSLMYRSKASLLKAHTSTEYFPSSVTKWFRGNLFSKFMMLFLVRSSKLSGVSVTHLFSSCTWYLINATSPSHSSCPKPALEKTPRFPIDTPIVLSSSSRLTVLDAALSALFSCVMRATACVTTHVGGRFSSVATLVNIRFTGTLTSMVSRTVTLQSTGGRLHINSCSLGQLAENTSQLDIESTKHDDEIVLGKGGGGEVTNGVEDCSLFAEVAGGVVTKGLSDWSPHEFDVGGEPANGVEDTRDVGVADGLHLRDEVSKDDACLRFLLDNSNRHRRVWVGICDCCDFALLSEVADSTFCLGAIYVVFDLNILCLWVHGTGDDFSVHVESDKHGEVTDACGRFFLPLLVLSNFRRLFFAIPFFFVFRARGVSLLSHFHSTIFCLKTFSQQVSSYSSLSSPSAVTMQHKFSVYS